MVRRALFVGALLAVAAAVAVANAFGAFIALRDVAQAQSRALGITC